MGDVFDDFKNELNITNEDKLFYFGDGPWVTEPDWMEFEHEGIKCLVCRIVHREIGSSKYLFGGHLCGYVCIPAENRLYSEDDICIKAHGGITYDRISDHWRIVGFDCAHYMDIVPYSEHLIDKAFSGYKDRLFLTNGRYRDFDYVKGEVKRMAEQVAGKEVANEG